MANGTDPTRKKGKKKVDAAVKKAEKIRKELEKRKEKTGTSNPWGGKTPYESPIVNPDILKVGGSDPDVVETPERRKTKYHKGLDNPPFVPPGRKKKGRGGMKMKSTYKHGGKNNYRGNHQYD